jgi:hypothetical protein
MVYLIGLSDLEFHHVFQTCSHVKFDDYPSHVLRHILVETLKKTSPALAATIHGYSRLELELLLTSIKQQLAVFNAAPETVLSEP